MGKVSEGLPKTARRMVREVLYGMQGRGSVRLSEMARSSDEKTSMRKVIERLSRQLNRQGLRVPVRENLPQLAAQRVDRASLLTCERLRNLASPSPSHTLPYLWKGVLSLPAFIWVRR